MRIHYLQHVGFEGPAYIDSWLQEQGHERTVTRFYIPGYRLPEVNETDALIVMGGPMGVYDNDGYPWLAEELSFIRNCIRAGKKVLGICLGAQLLAVCLGARVEQASNKEIGWFEVQPTAASREVPWFYALFNNRPVVFHWHGDRFGVPEGSIHMLDSVANNNQAFYYNPHIIGLQFHLEVTASSVDELLQAAASDLDDTAFVQTASAINAGKAALANCNNIMADVLQHWLSA